ncbi:MULTISPECIES: YggT family protein [Staphylococcus]|jgi:YggT family protein|uniref:YggT family protein n=1 Tax=Staphylococcus shinii TaxID=2912228 RepID=A0A418IFR7_9STAP|nr:YggT family protein [Staphylococcus shinii]MBO3064500.1 YggT family protein [Staphylococcus shinii]MDW8564750.1 YggT family protein [Staphylococcus shinii]MDW8567984.1 YggT family protein [Staphylococcus shinii]MDW8570787.1 YggT family protein [Staphylococcus shinii]MDW8573308.1 YggT family protein [Staphylococcus shinii]
MDIGLLANIFNFILFLVQIYYYGMIVYFVMSWIPNARENKFGQFLSKLYEPFLEQFRKVIPPIGMIDISSIVAIVVLVLFRSGLASIFNLILTKLM